MTRKAPITIETIQTACKAGSVMAGLAFSEVLDRDLQLIVHDTESFDGAGMPESMGGPGVLLVLEIADGALAVVLPSSLPFLPDWCHDPSEVGTRLDSLAHRLRIFVPDGTPVVHSWAIYVPDVREALGRAGLAREASRIRLELSDGARNGTAQLVWPLSSVEQLLIPDDVAPVEGTNGGLRYASLEEGLKLLPPYTRSLLRIRLTASVTLASMKQSLRRILELGPGSIISFKKSCDEMLTLEVGNHVIAEGEAVKVGDKFGLWITSMTLPKERFRKVMNEVALQTRSRQQGT